MFIFLKNFSMRDKIIIIFVIDNSTLIEIVVIKSNTNPELIVWYKNLYLTKNLYNLIMWWYRANE